MLQGEHTCSLETIVIIIHRCAKVNPVFAKICVFSRGKDFAVLVWLDIIALGRYTVFIAAGSCEGVEAPDLVFIGLNCASGGARTVWGFVRLFDFRRNLHEDFVF